VSSKTRRWPTQPPSSYSLIHPQPSTNADNRREHHFQTPALLAVALCTSTFTRSPTTAPCSYNPNQDQIPGRPAPHRRDRVAHERHLGGGVGQSFRGTRNHMTSTSTITGSNDNATITTSVTETNAGSLEERPRCQPHRRHPSALTATPPSPRRQGDRPETFQTPRLPWPAALWPTTLSTPTPAPGATLHPLNQPWPDPPHPRADSPTRTTFVGHILSTATRNHEHPTSPSDRRHYPTPPITTIGDSMTKPRFL